MRTIDAQLNCPTNYLNFMSGTFTKKVIVKLTSIDKAGTVPIYIQVFVNKVRKQFPIGLRIDPKHFDRKKQRVKASFVHQKDYNLIIEKELAKLNEIAVSYRLRNEYLTLDKLKKELDNGFSRSDFIKYYSFALESQKERQIIATSTYKQQKATLEKLKGFRTEIYFHQINEVLIEDFKVHLRKKLKNGENTVFTALKNLKKYLHLAFDDGITTPLPYNKIKVKRIKGNRDFLEDFEVANLYKYYKTSYINPTYKKVLKKFLFSCFTGLRISDVTTITQNNLIGDYLVFNAVKGNKFNKIPLIDAAKEFINMQGPVFDDDLTEQCINENLKEIAKHCGIKKRVTFHVARHTFATNYLIKGGKVEELKELLGHSKIETTMIYVHIVKKHQNSNMQNLNNILKSFEEIKS
jgi:site-specific recombinase XerD